MGYQQDGAEALRWAREMVAGGQSRENAMAICLKDWHDVHGYSGPLPFDIVQLPTYASPGPGYGWQVRTDPSGHTSGLWVFEGDRFATGKGIQPTETVAQYAMRMGLPAGIAFTFRTADEVDAELAGKTRPNVVLKSGDNPVFAAPPVTTGAAPAAPAPVTYTPPDPARQKALEMEAARIATFGLSIYTGTRIGTPKELNDIMGSFNPAYDICAWLANGESIDKVMSTLQGAKGFEAYTRSDVESLAAMLAAGGK